MPASSIPEFQTPPARVLVIRLSALGDVVNCLPALTALRELWPDTVFDWLTETAGSGLLMEHPDLDRVITLPRKSWQRTLLRPTHWFSTLASAWRSLRELRRHRYDVVVDFQGNLRSKVTRSLARARLSVTHHPDEVKEGAARGARTPSERSGIVNRVRKNLHLVRALGWHGDDSSAVARLPGTNGVDAAQRAPTSGQAPVLLQPFASAAGRIKEWPAASFARLARQLVEHGLEVWIGWGPGEEQRAAAILADSHGAELAPATHNAAELVQLLRRARAVVAADTGPLHIAALAGTPVVGLYGPKDPRVYRPWTERQRLLRAGVPCSPCTLRRCPHSVCMQLISPEAVAAAVLELLAEVEGPSTASV